jgi:DNA-binding MarR family transcriptional regulator
MKPVIGDEDENREVPHSMLRSVMLSYMKTMKLHRCILEMRLKKTGVYRSQHQILMILSDHTNVSQKELAERLYVSTATIAVTVKKLEKGGYITRLMNQNDNRMNKLCLTEKGRHMVELSREYFMNVEEWMFHDFSKEELAAMEQFMNRIYNNLSEIHRDNDMTERED